MSPETPWQKAVYQDELDTLRAEIERLTHLVQEIEDRRRNLEDVSCNQQADIMHLRAAVERLTRERDAARAVLPFFRSVIQCGELWTAVCDMQYRAGMGRAALKASETQS